LDRSPRSINNLKKLIYKDNGDLGRSQNSFRSPSKTRGNNNISKKSRSPLKSKSRSARKKKLSQHEKDQAYKRKLKIIGNTYMYQALENTKVRGSNNKAKGD
jgi:hypothetical protein